MGTLPFVEILTFRSPPVERFLNFCHPADADVFTLAKSCYIKSFLGFRLVWSRRNIRNFEIVTYPRICTKHVLDIEIKILTPKALFFGPESKEDDHLTWISSQYEVIESNLKNWFISFSQKQNIKHWKMLKR